MQSRLLQTLKFIASTGFSFWFFSYSEVSLSDPPKPQFLLPHLYMSKSYMWNRIWMLSLFPPYGSLLVRLSSQIECKESFAPVFTGRRNPSLSLTQNEHCYLSLFAFSSEIFKIVLLFFGSKLSFKLIFMEVVHPSLMVAIIACSVRMKYAHLMWK